MSNEMSFKRITFYVINSLCFGALLFQVYLTSNEYFHYPSVTRITIKTIKKLAPPDSSVCISIDYLLNPVQIKQITGRDISSCKYTDIDCMKWFYNHSMDQIMNQFTHHLQDRLIDAIFEASERNLTVDTFYRNLFKCLRISFGQKIISREELNHLSLDYPLYSMTFNLTGSNNKYNYHRIHYMIHEVDTLPLLDDTRSVTIDIKENNAHSFTFQKVMNQRLGFPYGRCQTRQHHQQTRRHHQKMSSRDSRASCVQKCLIDTYDAMNIVLLARTTNQYNFKPLDGLDLVDYAGVQYLEPFPVNVSIRKFCSEKCIIDCDSVSYIPIILSELSEEWIDVDTGYIELQANEPVIDARTCPMYVLIDYFTYLISMPGAWLGLSVHLFFDLIILIVQRSLATTKIEVTEATTCIEEVKPVVRKVDTKELFIRTSRHLAAKRLLEKYGGNLHGSYKFRSGTVGVVHEP